MSDRVSISNPNPMSNSTLLLRLFVVVATLIPTSRAVAQRSDAEWLANCRDDRGDHSGRREVFCEVREVRLRAPTGTISMEGLRNGGVTVTGWDRDSIVVTTRIRAQARSESMAREIARAVRTVVRGSTIGVEGPRNGGDEQWSASLLTMVPRRSDLRVGTSNGPVSVGQIRGDMELRTSNGPMSLRDLGGNVRARTTNGPLAITLSGSRWDGTGLDARTTNGPLVINVPANYNAQLESGTTNGPVDIGFPITVVGRITRDISAQLGSGGPTIRATTTNGPLSIRRR